MDNVKTGRLIRQLRTERRMTQLQLAERLHVSDKAISKWERGLGCPDVALLSGLAAALDVDLENLLSGELDEKETSGGNMKNLRFYVCPTCGNVITAASDAGVSCCGKKLQALCPRKAEETEKLRVEIIENDYCITGSHPMLREHYVSFAALVTPDALLLRRLYPEWDLQTRIPAVAHGKLLWYCTAHGLFYQLV